MQSLVPAVHWVPYLTAMFAPVAINESEPVVVYAKEYLQKVSELINQTDKRSVTLNSLLFLRLYFLVFWLLDMDLKIFTLYVS